LVTLLDVLRSYQVLGIAGRASLFGPDRALMHCMVEH
jgi:hypothetical protein